MNGARWVAVAAGAIGVSLAIAVSLTQYAHNEEMYVAAGVLVSEGWVPYRDFAYLQSPYLVWLYGALFRAVVAPGHYLLAAKLVSVLAYLVTLLLVYRIARIATRAPAAAALIAALCAVNLLVVFTTAEASNYAVPLALAVGAFDAFLQAPRRWFVCGLLLGLAIGVKLTFAPLGLPLLVAAIAGQTRAWRLFGAGLAVALAPFAAHLLAGLDVVAFSNVEFHRLQAAWRVAEAMGPSLTLADKTWLGGILLVTQPPNLWTLAAVAVGALWAGRRAASQEASVCVGLAAGGLFAALYATPAFPQYFAMPAVWTIVTVAFLWRPLLVRAPDRAMLVLTVIVLGAAVSIVPMARSVVTDAADSRTWAHVRLRQAGIPLRLALDARPDLRGRRVATLWPIMALEQGLPIYRELATGTFAYWAGDLVDDARRRRFVISSPSSIAALLAAEPPAAIVVGQRDDLEVPFRTFAESHGYQGPFPASFGLEFYVAAR